MDFETALRNELMDITELSGKVYPVSAPQGTQAPYATWETSDKNEDKDLDGYQEGGTVNVTIDLFAKTYSDIKLIGRIVKTALKTFQGRQIGGGGPTIQNLTFEDFLPELWEGEIELFRKIISFAVYY